MNSDRRLFLDDEPVDFFCKCAKCENDIKELMEYWERIKLMDSSCLQVYIRSMEWIPMLERFLEQWGEYCASDDMHRCYLMVHE